MNLLATSERRTHIVSQMRSIHLSVNKVQIYTKHVCTWFGGLVEWRWAGQAHTLGCRHKHDRLLHVETHARHCGTRAEPEKVSKQVSVCPLQLNYFFRPALMRILFLFC